MRTSNFYLQKSYNAAQVGFLPHLVKEKCSFQDQKTVGFYALEKMHPQNYGT